MPNSLSSLPTKGRTQRRGSVYDPSDELWHTKSFIADDLGSPLMGKEGAAKAGVSRWREMSIKVKGTAKSMRDAAIAYDEDEAGQTSEEEKDPPRSSAKISLGLSINLVLLISSTIASASSFAIDMWIQRLVPNFKSWAFSIGIVPELYMELVISVLLAWSARWFVWLQPPCAGSGIPEVKCMLSGEKLRHYLSWRVALCKACGLGLASSAGLQIGKEGPFVHIATCISKRLIDKFNFFSILRHKQSRETILLAGVAVGVGTTFSAPISGVLLAVELMMPHLYTKVDFRACFFGAIVGSLVFMSLQMLASGSGQLRPLLASDVEPESNSSLWPELLFIGLCCVLGLICGLLGALFVQMQMKMTRVVSWMRGIADHALLGGLVRRVVPASVLTRLGTISLIKRDLILLATLTSSVGLFRIYGGTPLYGLSLPALCDELMMVHSPMQPALWTCFALIVVKWCMVIFSLSMPVPCGVVAPGIAIGAIIGRFFGMIVPGFLRDVLDPGGDFSSYEARFAIIGASAFAAAVCHAMAMVVTVFELLAIPRIVIPLTFATYLSVRTAAGLSPSIFDAILVLKKLPGLPSMQANAMQSMTVEDALQKSSYAMEKVVLYRNVSLSDLAAVERNLAVLEAESQSIPKSLPLVERLGATDDNGHHLGYLGSLETKRFRAWLRQYVEENDAQEPTPSSISQFSLAARNNGSGCAAPTTGGASLQVLTQSRPVSPKSPQSRQYAFGNSESPTRGRQQSPSSSRERPDSPTSEGYVVPGSSLSKPLGKAGMRLQRIIYRGHNFIESIRIENCDGRPISPQGLPPAGLQQPQENTKTIRPDDAIISVTQYGHTLGHLGRAFQFRTRLGETVLVRGSQNRSLFKRDDILTLAAGQGMIVTGLKFNEGKLVGLVEEAIEDDMNSRALSVDGAGVAQDNGNDDGKIDFFRFAVAAGLMGKTVEAEKHKMLQKVYIQCHAEHYDRTIMVLDGGRFLGLFTLSDIFKKLK